MKNKDFERSMRALEYFHNIKLIPNTWAVIRVDGRAFHSVTNSYDKPFDAKFHDSMIDTAKELMKDMGGIYAYTQSDEISVLFPPEWDLFDRELEKIVSVSAGVASAYFGFTFDSRVSMLPTLDVVLDYFRWRQADAWRNCVSSYLYWQLIKSGKSPKATASEMFTKSNSEKLGELDLLGVHIQDVPAWQRNGTGIYYTKHTRLGYNKVKNVIESAVRRNIVVQDELPTGEQYTNWLKVNVLESKR